MGIIWPLFLIVLSSFIIWRSTGGFEMASDFLGRKLSQGIKGATINAIASSMPEFLATIFFLFYLKDSNGFSGGIGVIGGSAVFNILVIPISIYFVLFFTKKIKYIPIVRRTFLRDGIILLVMTCFVAWVVSREKLTIWHGLGLALPYIAYLIYLFFTHKKIITKTDNFIYSPSTGGVSWKDYALINLEKSILRNRPIHTTNAWVLLIVSTLVMTLGTWFLVYGTNLLGNELGIPIIFISVILASAASSIPDTIISIRDARKGNYEDAFANALGSNIFDISFALGFPLFLFTLLNAPIQMDPAIREISVDLWIVLIFITAITVLIFSIGKTFNGKKAILLTITYLLFIAYIVEKILEMEN